MANLVRILLVLSMTVAMTALVLFAARDRDSGEPLALSPAAAPTQDVAPTATPGLAFAPVAPEWVAVAAEIPDPLYSTQSFVADIETGRVWQIGDPDPAGPVFVWPLAWSPDAELLVAVATQNSAALFIGEPGLTLSPVVSLDATVSSAAWSPDGELIAVAGSGVPPPNAIAVLDAKNGKVVSNLSSDFAQVIGWSADSQFVAFADDSAIARVVLVWERRTGKTEQISTWWGVWSNTGARFAYGPPRGPGSDEVRPGEVWVRDFEESIGALIATTDAAQPEPLGWSADDSLLAISLFGNHEALVIDPAAPEVGLLVRAADPAGWVGASETLLFTGNMCGEFDVFTVRADGTGLHNYTDSPDLEMHPRASPNGQHVAFNSFGDGLSAIRLIELSSGEISELALGSGVSLFENTVRPEIVWSPDSRYVVFGGSAGYDFCLGTEPQTTTVDLLP